MRSASASYMWEVWRCVCVCVCVSERASNKQIHFPWARRFEPTCLWRQQRRCIENDRSQWPYQKLNNHTLHGTLILNVCVCVWFVLRLNFDFPSPVFWYIHMIWNNLNAAEMSNENFPTQTCAGLRIRCDREKRFGDRERTFPFELFIAFVKIDDKNPWRNHTTRAIKMANRTMPGCQPLCNQHQIVHSLRVKRAHYSIHQFWSVIFSPPNGRSHFSSTMRSDPSSHRREADK